ncbi:ribonuclease H-like domain-containing protein [Tanacetum coccineum]|uniref:Ribonuclease H-like domain-containing protein n=1 Tax=Tanacetum coccineum TaxID=301880 RepID=A0ABQ4WRC7_9ASTR
MSEALQRWVRFVRNSKIFSQVYKNFAAASQEGLDKTYDRFQKLISQLEIHGEVISQEDVNLKLLRSLPSAWNNIALIMRNKSDLDTLSKDDLYNNLKVYESNIKGKSSSSLNSQNVAFVSSDNSSSTNETVNTAHSVSAASSKDQASTASYANDVMFSFFANLSNAPQDYEDLEQIDAYDLEEMDLKWAPRNKGNRNRDAPRRNAPLDTSTTNALVVQDGIVQTLSRESDMDDSPVNDRFKTGEGFHAVPPPYTGNYMPSRPDLSFAGLDDSVYKTKVSKTETKWDTDNDNNSVFRPKYDQTKPSIEQNKPSYAKISFVKSDENTRKSVIKQNTYRKAENLRIIATKSRLVPVNAAKQSSPRAASSISNARHVNTAALKPKVNAALPIKYSYFKAHSPLRRHFNQKSAAKTNNFNKKVYTAKVNNVTTNGPEVVVSTTEGKKENAIKSSACWIWRPTGKVIDHISKDSGSYMLKRFDYDQGIFDSGCSRHMTGNKSYLTDYQDIDGGFVAFDGSPKGGKIIRKGKIRTEKLDFEDVYFVKELKFNLFSVSQMCDKKNCVLFTETKCLVLSPDFKLLDKSQVLLKVPRQNMYSFDLKNVIPLGGLTCLFAKATIDESNLWHRRPGHWYGYITKRTKIMAKWTKPSMGLERARKYKAEDIRKTYCLVVTNDFSRFSWVFFLATKDETSGILKAFITGIENQINHKAEAVNTACYVQNRVLVTKPHNKTPYELLHGRPPSISFMRPFGCPVTILNTLDPLGNFDGKADEGFLVGYFINSNAFRVFNTRTRKVEENLHITFFENKPNVAESGPDWLFDIDLQRKLYDIMRQFLSEGLCYQHKRRRLRCAGFGAHPTMAPENEEPGPYPRRKKYEGEESGETKTKKTQKTQPRTEDEDEAPKRARSLWTNGEELLLAETYIQVSEDPKEGADQQRDTFWYKVMDVYNKEAKRFKYPNRSKNMITGKRNRLRVMEEDPEHFSPDALPRPDEMYRIQKSQRSSNSTASSGSNPRMFQEMLQQQYDVREQARMKQDVLERESRARVDLLESQKIAEDMRVAQCIQLGKEPKKVIQALDDPSWIESCQEELLFFKFQKVWTLVDIPNGKRAIGNQIEEGINYDEVFAPIARIEAIRRRYLVRYMCANSWFEDPQFPDKVYSSGKKLYMVYIKLLEPVQVYVDDIIFGSTKKSLCVEFEQMMHKRFQMSFIGELAFFLGLQVKQKDNGIFISQDKYVADILKKFDFNTVKTTSTPIDTNKALLKDEEAEDVHLYRSMIRSLMYLTASRPDIMFAICTCARFQVTSKVSHLHAVKRIFKYLKGQPKLGLWYPKYLKAGGGVESRVRESDGGDRIDREMGRIFGVGRKSSPENFSGGHLCIVDTLVAIMSTRPRTTSIVIRDVEKEPRRATPNTNKAKDAALIEQMEDIQARMDADELLAERLQQEEREQFTIEEKSRMLVEMIAERKRFFAA